MGRNWKLCLLAVLLAAACSSGKDAGDAGNVDTTDAVVADDSRGPGDAGTAETGTTDGGVGEEAVAREIEPEVAAICEPGQIDCVDIHTKKSCDDEGTGWEEENCEPGFACDLGYCLEQICEPGELKGECLGPGSFALCHETGTKWIEEYCDAPLKCYEGECKDYICEPGEVTCKGITAVQECQLTQEDETEWVVVEECKLGVCQEGVCKSACEVELKDSYLGCDYWAVDLDNVEGGQFMPVALVVSLPSYTADAATISMTNMAKSPPQELTAAELGVDDMTVPPGGLKTFFLPSGLDLDGTIMNHSTVHVNSNAPVTVHQFNPINGAGVYTNDASLLLPANMGGELYYVMSWPMRVDNVDNGYTFRGTATIVATQEGVTTISVRPTSKVMAGPGVQELQAYPPEPYAFVMERGDVLNLETEGAHGTDLTGTKITADRKISVFGGHECANVPLFPDVVSYCDHVEQQLFPVQAWGSHYVADAFEARSPAQKDVWRVLSGAKDVHIEFDPPVAGPYVLNEGTWVEFSAEGNFEVTATGPVMLGHFLQGSKYDGFEPAGDCYGGTGIGDPAFTLAVPVEQYLDEYIVTTPMAYVEDYVNIIAKAADGISVTIDGEGLSVPLEAVGGGEYGVARVSIADGVHTIKAQDPFGVTAYGYDCDVSYAYPGGLALKAL